MQKIIIGITIFLSILLSSSLLKGAGIGFNSWYAAPEGLSRFLVTIITMAGLAKGCVSIAKRLFK